MSSGGGKGGGKSTTTTTTVPNWIRDPAARNLRRAEQVQQLEYMPYYGGQVAAFNENQTQAMQNNANAATAFGLLAPTDVMGSMPTPTTYANGMKGYGSIGLYDQALAQLTAANPDNMAAYNSLFGNEVAPINLGRQGGGGGGGGGGFRPSRTTSGDQFVPNYDVSTWTPDEQRRHKEQISPTSTVSESDNAYRGNTGTGINYKAIVADMNRKKHTQDWGKWTGV
jgi:hypothetical protein